MKLIILISALALSLPIATNADHHSNTSQTDGYLLTDCKALNENADQNSENHCLTYIDAFLSGAILFDDLLIDHIVRDHSKDNSSDFFQRAYKTRLGTVDRPSYSKPEAPFCLTDGEKHPDVLKALLSQLPDTISSREHLNTVLLNTLRDSYPC